MSPDKTPRISQQASRAKDELVVKLVHLAMPWAGWVLLTILANVLRIAAGRYEHGRWMWLAVTMVLVAGGVVAFFDHHLRRHRATAFGRFVGPVTTAAVACVTAAYLLAGVSAPLALTYLFGGVISCLTWDIWMTHAVHHDLGYGFARTTQRAGIGTGRITAIDRPKRPAPARVTGTVAWEPGEVTTTDAAERAENLEAAAHYPPGSWQLTRHPGDASQSNFTITDPRNLDTPRDWPGPSAMGATMAAPFRLGSWQDGDTTLIEMTPLFHVMGMGMSGSAKTTGFAYNVIGEGVTRREYAGIAIDLTKGEQFFGPLRPALHYVETDPDAALRRLAGVHRAVRARCDYLATKHLARWEPGCGLSWLDCWLEEAPDIIALLETAKSRMANAVLSLPTWTSDVKAGRTAGLSWKILLQRDDYSQMPTIVGGQMSSLCMGVDKKKDAAFGLSERQQDAGCRPELWRDAKPGMAYWDTPTLPAEYAVMPFRFWNWGPDTSRAAAYFAEWSAAHRPLDDVTGEALEAEPALPASYALPGPGGAPAGANVRQLFPAGQPAVPDRHSEADRAEQVVRNQLLKWLSEGKDTFTSFELQNSGILGKGKDQADRSRTWCYGAITAMVQHGYAEQLPNSSGRTRWRIIPPAAQATGDEEA